MTGLTVDGLVSGLNTSSLIDSLMSIESNSQTLLKQKLTTVQSTATAYRSVNSRFDALRTAAQTLTQAATWQTAKATSTDPSVTATVSGTATSAGSLTFSVDQLAATHGEVSATTWSSLTADSGYGSSLQVYGADGSSKGTVSIGGSSTLSDVVSAINGSGLGLAAAAVQVGSGAYRLQVTSTTSGAAGAFSLGGSGDFAVTTQGQDAHLTVGTGPGAYAVTSGSNTFSNLMPGVSLTVSKATAAGSAPTTVSVVTDQDAIASSVQSFVDAANAALSEVATDTKASSTGAGALAGDSTLTSLASRLLSGASNAVGSDGSPASIGLQLTRDGKITFDKTAFLAALTADPAKVQRMLQGTTAGAGADGVSGTSDDVRAVDGIASRIQTLAAQASDSTTGTITALANGRDTAAKDLQTQIDDWDVRLASRRTTLTAQFTAMEVALSTMKSQSSWLTSALSGLSSTSTSSSSSS